MLILLIYFPKEYITMKRAAAVRLPIEVLVGKKLILDDENRTYLSISEGLKVSRINIWGNVARKYVSEKGFGALALDDFSAVIDVNFFKENVALIDHIEAGAVVEVVGKPRMNQNNELTISAESVRKINFSEEMLRRVENAKNSANLDSINAHEEESEIGEEEIPEFRVEKNIVE